MTPTWLDDVSDPTQGILELDQLVTLTVPVLLTVGGRSDPLDAAVAAYLAEALPDPIHHTFAEAGHIPHLTHPGLFVEVVSGFLDHVGATAP